MSFADFSGLLKNTGDEAPIIVPFICTNLMSQQCSILSGFKPFTEADPDYQKAMEIVFGGMGTISEQKGLGAFIGMGVGDALGAPLEFQPYRPRGPPLISGMTDLDSASRKLKAGQWTDDSAMGLCLADSILKTWPHFSPQDSMVRYLGWWYLGYNNAFGKDDLRRNKKSIGLGGNIRESFKKFLEGGPPLTVAGDTNTSGNGSIMRLAGVAVAHHRNLEECVRVAELQSRVTHQGEEAAGCAVLLATIIATGIKSESTDPRQIIEEATKNFKFPSAPSVEVLALAEMENENPDRDWRWKQPEFYFSPTRAAAQPTYIGSYAMDALAMALHCVYTTSSFSESVLKAANMCGDADSTAAVTAQIAGAIYGVRGIPAEWIRTLEVWDHGAFTVRAYKLYRIGD